MSPSFIETRANGRVYILMLEFVDRRVKITSHRSIGDMPADVRRKYLAWVATRRVVAERDSRLPTLHKKDDETKKLALSAYETAKKKQEWRDEIAKKKEKRRDACADFFWDHAGAFFACCFVGGMVIVGRLFYAFLS